MKSVLVTGSSAGGIGAAVCLEFQKKGLHVFATARTPSKLGELQSLPNVTPIALDVTSPQSIAAAVEAVRSQTGGKLDYLVNNSGAQYVAPTLDMDLDEARKMYEVNVWGVLAMCQAFAPLLVAAKGTIVNIASIAALLTVPWMGVYGGSKAAIDLISETLRLELAPFDVKVITCVTGAIKTNLMANSLKPVLPHGSLYKPVEKNISERASGHDVNNTSTPEEFARGLVADTLGGATGKVYRGKMSSLTKFISGWLPTGMLDGMLSKGTGLAELPGRTKSA